ncbi:MAG TPA: cystathionine beta-lyase [Dongiaceae bacterium]|jgi:cystathionine beta-lyase|nr:cystathionine beta-lyase [Dongiaceae bacterium]
MDRSKNWRDRTKLTHSGNRPYENHGVVNPPVYHASTILYRTVAELRMKEQNPFDHVTYGRTGTPTTFAFEQAVAALEQADRAVALPSGLAAIAGSLFSFLKAGDHLLMTDTTYAPTRKLCDHQLARLGITTTYYDPMIGAGIAELIQPNTRVIYLESPGSHTFEVQDVPAMAEVARARDCVTMIDNTWASPLFFKPLNFGVDLSIHAATKYIVGHSDVMMGVVSMREKHWRTVKTQVHAMGYSVGPDDCYLALRGLRTLGARLAQHEKSALKVAEWLQRRPEVERVLHPAFPGTPGHEFFKRDFKGSSGLFSVILKPCSQQQLAAMLDGLELFGMGYSWGGYESLIVPSAIEKSRTATRWKTDGPMLRLHVGLEEPDDLIADLEAGFGRLRSDRPGESAAQ